MNTCHACGRPHTNIADVTTDPALLLRLVDDARADVTHYTTLLRLGLTGTAVGTAALLVAITLGQRGYIWVATFGTFGAIAFTIWWYAMNIAYADGWRVRRRLRNLAIRYDAALDAKP